MGERIELPAMPAGTEQEQLQKMYSYMYRTAQILNVNLAEIGNGALTDEEQMLFNRMTANNAGEEGQYYGGTYNYAEAETLKSLIIKTASFVKTEMDNYRIILFGEEAAESQYGNWIRKKGLRVDVTPDGIKQTYSYAEIIKGLKTFEINSKNYIKTGLLRTVQSIPVYGVAIGKDVVTFAEDGKETYKDENKVAELTAEELSFWQNEQKVASYTGDNVIFYQGGTAKLKIDRNGVTVLNGTTKLAELLGTALKFYYNGSLRTQMDAEGVKLYEGDTQLATISSSGINFTNGNTKLAELLTSALKFYYNGTLRAQMDTDGVTLQDGTLQTKIDADGLTVKDGNTLLTELLKTALKFYYNGSLRTQMDTDGVKFYDGGTLLATISSSGISFTNGSTKLAELLTSALKFYYNGTLRAQMDANGVTLQDGSIQTKIDSNGMTIKDGTAKLAEILSTALKFYYNDTLRAQMDANGVTLQDGTLQTKIDTNGMTVKDGSTLLAELLTSALKFYYNGTLRAQMDTNGVTLQDGTLQTKIDSSGMTIKDGTAKLAELLTSALKFYYNGALRAQMDANGVTLQDGTIQTKIDSNGMTIQDGNATLAEFLASALKLYYNGTLRTQMDTDGVKFYDGSSNLLAKISGSRIGFYYNGSEVMYIDSGKIYFANDAEIASGNSLLIKNGNNTAIRMDGDGIDMRTPGKFYLHALDASNSAIIFGSDEENPVLSISESGDLQCKNLIVNGAESQKIIISNNAPSGSNVIWVKPTPAGTEKEWDYYPDYLYFESSNCSIAGGGHSHDYSIPYTSADHISGNLIYSVNFAVYFYNMSAAATRKLKARLKNGSSWIDIGETPDPGVVCVNGTTLRLNVQTSQAEANVMDPSGGYFTLRLECNAPTSEFRIALQDIVLKAKTSSSSGFLPCSVFYKE